MREHELLNPRSFYGRTKVAGEVLLRGYRDLYGMQAVALRLASVYGPRRKTRCGFTELIRAALAGEVLRAAAPGSNYRQFIHVQDAASAILAALERPEWPSFAYNINGDDWTPEGEIASLVSEVVPGTRIEFGEEHWDEGHIGPLDGTAASNDLGYQSAIPSRSGAAQLVEQLRARSKRQQIR